MALVVGVPMDFRLGFGKAFGDETEIVAIDVAEPEREHPRAVAAELYGDLPTTLSALASATGPDTKRLGRAAARDRDREARGRARAARGRARAAASDARLRRARAGARPRRDRDRRRRRLRLLRRPRRRLLRRPAAGSTPARTAASAPGPATRSRPSSRIPTARSCCCSATAPSASPGWSTTRSPATASRVVGVMGNNGIWALEKHPMEFLYDGWSVAADLRPETPLPRGGRGARRPRRAGARAGRAARRAGARVRERQAGARERAHRPSVAYPRSANLA